MSVRQQLGDNGASEEEAKAYLCASQNRSELKNDTRNPLGLLIIIKVLNLDSCC